MPLPIDAATKAQRLQFPPLRKKKATGVHVPMPHRTPPQRTLDDEYLVDDMGVEGSLRKKKATRKLDDEYMEDDTGNGGAESAEQITQAPAPAPEPETVAKGSFKDVAAGKGFDLNIPYSKETKATSGSRAPTGNFPLPSSEPMFTQRQEPENLVPKSQVKAGQASSAATTPNTQSQQSSSYRTYERPGRPDPPEPVFTQEQQEYIEKWKVNFEPSFTCTTLDEHAYQVRKEKRNFQNNWKANQTKAKVAKLKPIKINH
jgi:hypothetical protein